MNNSSQSLVLDWGMVSQLQDKPKLSGLPFTAHHLFEDYYQVSETEFLSASRQVSRQFADEDIYIHSFYWAVSLGAFRRAVSRAGGALAWDDGKTTPLPSCLCLAPNCQTYGDIKAFVDKRLGRRTVDVPLGFENDRSLGACVSALRWGFYFRSAWSAVPDSEMPYAVSFHASKNALIPCD